MSYKEDNLQSLTDSYNYFCYKWPMMAAMMWSGLDEYCAWVIGDEEK